MSSLRYNMCRLMALRNFSEKTKMSYVWAVRGLAKYYHRSPDLINPQEIQDYLFYLIKERKLAWSTISLAVYGIKFFFHDFLGQPKSTYYIPVPKVPKRLPVIWTPDEIKQLLKQAPDNQIRTMIKTVYSAGLRLSEMVHLKVTDIDSSHTTLWIRQGKGKKDRAALLAPSLLHDLRVYWKQTRPKEWLFPRRKGFLYMRPEYFGHQFKLIKERVNPNKKCGVHSLRHSFATHLVACGADIYTVQKLLGHKSISSTMIYVHLAQGIILSKASHLDLLKLNALSN